MWKFGFIKNNDYFCTRKNPPSLSTMLKCAGAFFMCINTYKKTKAQGIIFLAPVFISPHMQGGFRGSFYLTIFFPFTI